MRDAGGRRAARGASVLILAALVGALFGAVVEQLWPAPYVARMLLAPGGLPADASVAPAGDAAGAETQRARLYSEPFLRAVVRRGRLDILIEADGMSAFDGARSGRDDAARSGPPVAGRTGYEFGDERVVITQFDVDAADKGATFVLQPGDSAGTFTLTGSQGETICAAAVGSDGCRTNGVTLVVEALQAPANRRFQLRRVAPQVVAAELAQQLEVTSFGMTGGLLAVELQGPDPQRLRASAWALAEEFEQRPAAMSARQEALIRLGDQLKQAGGAFAAAQRALEQSGDSAFGGGAADVDARERIAAIAGLEAQRIRAVLASDPTTALLLPDGDTERAGAAQAVAELDRRIQVARAQLIAGHPAPAALERELALQVASECYLTLLDVRAAQGAAQASAGPTARIVEPPSVMLLTPPDQRRWRFIGISILAAVGLASAWLARRARERMAMATPLMVAAWTGVPVVAVIDNPDPAGPLDAERNAGTGQPQDAAEDAAAGELGAERIGIDSLATWVAVDGARRDCGHQVVGISALQAAYRPLAQQLVDAICQRGGVAVVESEDGIASDEAPGLRAAPSAPAVVVRTLPRVVEMLAGAARPTPDRVLLGVSAWQDGRRAVRNALQRLRARSIEVDGIVLMRQGPVPATATRLRRNRKV